MELSPISASIKPDLPPEGRLLMVDGPTHLVATDPAVGLTAEHVEDLLRWRSAVAG